MCSGSCTAEGCRQRELGVKETVRFLEFLGYTNVVMKTDQEVALKSLMAKVRSHRGDQTQTMHEVGPVGTQEQMGSLREASKVFKVR